MSVSIPRNTASATLAWMEQFLSVVGANSSAYGLTASQVAALTPLVANFRARFNIAGVESGVAVNPGGYTKPNREAMYAARSAALGVCQGYAALIQANSGIADSLKLAAGVVPKNFTRTPLVIPASNPLLVVSSFDVRSHVLSWTVSDTPGVARLPVGARGVMLFGVSSAMVVTDASELPFLGQFTRSSFKTPQWMSGDVGKTAYYAARWFGAREQLGPMSAIVSATVAG